MFYRRVSLYVLRLTDIDLGNSFKKSRNLSISAILGSGFPYETHYHYLFGFSYSAGSLVAINCHKKLCCFGRLQFTLDITEECFDLSKGGRSSGLHICFFSVKKAQGNQNYAKCTPWIFWWMDIMWCHDIYLKWWFETQAIWVYILRISGL